MCACDVGFICKQCAGTPFDPSYDFDQEPISPQEFDALVESYVTPWEGEWV